MPKIISPQIGSNVNNWTIMAVLEKHSGRTTVLAKCECGIVKKIAYTRITSGITKSCGCHFYKSIYPKKYKDLNQSALQDILNYNPESGNFYWIKKIAHRVNIGDMAGCHDGDGYICIRIHGKTYKAHNLVWLYCYGRWGQPSIDHINRVRDDNRLSNLREATLAMQQHNKNVASPHPGVVWDKERGLWKAQIRVSGNRIYLGRFQTIEQATEARERALTNKLFAEQEKIQHKLAPYADN